MSKKIFNNPSNNNQKTFKRNLTESTKYVIVLSQICCACPINLQSNPKKVLANRCSNFGHFIFSVFLLTLLMYAAYNRYFDSQKTLSFMLSVLNAIEYTFSIINCSLVIFGCYYQKECYLRYFNNIIEIDVALQRISRNLPVCTLKSYLNKMVIAFLVSMTFSFGMTCFYQRTFSRTIAAAIINILPNIITFLSVFQYTALLYVIQERYKKINLIITNLSKSIESTKQSNNRFEIGLTSNFVSRKMIDHDETYTLELINLIQSIFQSLTKLERNTCQSFAVLVVTLLISTFIILCSQLYALYKLVQDLDHLNIIVVFYKIVWMSLHSAQVIIMLIRNDKLLQEVNQKLLTLKKVLSGTIRI